MATAQQDISYESGTDSDYKIIDGLQNAFEAVSEAPELTGALQDSDGNYWVNLAEIVEGTELDTAYHNMRAIEDYAHSVAREIDEVEDIDQITRSQDEFDTRFGSEYWRHREEKVGELINGVNMPHFKIPEPEDML